MGQRGLLHWSTASTAHRMDAQACTAPCGHTFASRIFTTVACPLDAARCSAVLLHSNHAQYIDAHCGVLGVVHAPLCIDRVERSTVGHTRLRTGASAPRPVCGTLSTRRWVLGVLTRRDPPARVCVFLCMRQSTREPAPMRNRAQRTCALPQAQTGRWTAARGRRYSEYSHRYSHSHGCSEYSHSHRYSKCSEMGTLSTRIGTRSTHIGTLGTQTTAHVRDCADIAALGRLEETKRCLRLRLRSPTREGHTAQSGETKMR